MKFSPIVIEWKRDLWFYISFLEIETANRSGAFLQFFWEKHVLEYYPCTRWVREFRWDFLWWGIFGGLLQEWRER